jgi:hypothetical protein
MHSAPARRPEVEKIFAYPAGLAAPTDLGSATDPLDQFKFIVRDLSSKYGEIEIGVANHAPMAIARNRLYVRTN